MRRVIEDGKLYWRICICRVVHLQFALLLQFPNQSRREFLGDRADFEDSVRLCRLLRGHI